MKPEIWGKPGWTFFHLMTVGYPETPTEQNKLMYYEYVIAFSNVLPCDRCKYNLKDHLKKFPLTNVALASRQNFVKWGIDLHNIVNYYTEKPMLSYEEAFNDLNKLMHPEEYKSNEYMWYIIIFAIVILLVYIIYYKYKKIEWKN